MPSHRYLSVGNEGSVPSISSCLKRCELDTCHVIWGWVFKNSTIAWHSMSDHKGDSNHRSHWGQEVLPILSAAPNLPYPRIPHPHTSHWFLSALSLVNLGRRRPASIHSRQVEPSTCCLHQDTLLFLHIVCPRAQDALSTLPIGTLGLGLSWGCEKEIVVHFFSVSCT